MRNREIDVAPAAGGPFPDLTLTLGRVLTLACAAIPCDRAAIHLVDGDRLVIKATCARQGLEANRDLVGQSLALDEGFCGHVLQTGRPFRCPDVAVERRVAPSRLAGLGLNRLIRSFLGVPLRLDDAVIGVLELDSNEPDFFQEHHVELAEVVADQATVIIENVRLAREAQERQSELQALKEFGDLLIETIPTGVAVLDHDGRFTQVNSALCKMAGYPAEVLRGQRLTALFPEVTRTVLLASLEQVWARGETVRFTDFYYPYLERGEAWFDLSLVPVHGRGGQVEAVMVAVTEITAIRANDRLKDDLISIIGHELRTPLTSILGYSKLLFDQPDASHERRAQWARFILEKSRLLNRLINDVLDLSRLNMGRFELKFKAVGLDGLVRRVADEFSLTTDRHPIVVEVTGQPAPIQADEDRLEQVLINLLGNAIKYSPDGGPILVRLEEVGDNLCLSITDSGVGIAPEHLPHIFEPFYRVDNRVTRSVYGTGLGLTISQAIVEAHGGTLTVESVPGQGTTFHITLPRQAGHEGELRLPTDLRRQ